MRWHGVKKAHGVSGVIALAVMILASVCTAHGAVAAQASGTPASRPAWRADIAKILAPGKGCFTATFPALEWQKAACVRTPSYPQPPRHGARPFTVGNNDDVAAQVPAGSHISTAIGSFDSVTGVTSESGPIGNTGPALLQIDEAKQVCRRCPVMEPCLEWAVESGQDAGVWGGMSEDERRAYKRRSARVRVRA